MTPVSFQRIWGWTIVGLMVLWSMHRQYEGWPAPLSDWWPFYVVSAVLLLILSFLLAWWPISRVVHLYQEQADARGQGKTEIRVVLPEALKAELEQEAAEQGVDRSTWIAMRLQTIDASGESGEVARRLSELARDSAVMREALTQLHEDLRQVVVLIEAFMAAVGKPAAPAEKVYPTPATWEETYPELYAPKLPEPTPAVVSESPSPVKRWPWQR